MAQQIPAEKLARQQAEGGERVAVAESARLREALGASEAREDIYIYRYMYR